METASYMIKEETQFWIHSTPSWTCLFFVLQIC